MAENDQPAPTTFWHEAAVCALVAAVSLGLGAARLGVWRGEVGVPLQYGHDSFTNVLMIKTTIDHGWWMTNPSVGAPGGLEWHDYPFNPNLHMAVIKGLSLFTRDAFLLLNVYFLLTFPLIALTSYAALRGMDVSRWPAAAVAILFAFMHYHFWRGVGHLYLAAYFMVPLVALLVVWLSRGEPLLFERPPEGGWRLRLTNRVTLLALAICVAVGLDFPYYPVFAGFFLMTAGCLLAGLRGESLPLWRAAGLTAAVAAGLALNLAPNVAHRIKHGRNSAPDHVGLSRPWADSEEFALKPVQLLLPANNHPVAAMRRLRDTYYKDTRTQSEQDSISIGLCASLGLMVALSALFWAHGEGGDRRRLFHVFGLLIAATLLVGTVGGFFVLPGLFGFTMVRCFNRVSIFLGFFGLAAFALLLDAVARRWPAGAWWRVGGAAGLAALVWLGIKDQATFTYNPSPEDAAAEFHSDRDFVGRIEAALPEGAMVFQLPHISFLSYRNAEAKMEPYSHFRGYFHSRSLRWSFGAMHGREASMTHARIAARPLKEQLPLLAHLGFGGLYVDRHGYEDGGEAVVAFLRRELGREPIVSADGRLLFFDMRAFGERLRSDAGMMAWAGKALSSPFVEWGGEFEKEAEDGCRWCGKGGWVRANNLGGKATTVRLAASLRAPAGRAATVRVSTAEGVIRTVEVPAGGVDVEVDVPVPAGKVAYCWFGCVDAGGEKGPRFALHGLRVKFEGPSLASR